MFCGAPLGLIPHSHPPLPMFYLYMMRRRKRLSKGTRKVFPYLKMNNDNAVCSYTWAIIRYIVLT